MFYVYSQHVKTGKQDFIKVFDTMEEAVACVRRNYNIDAEHCAKDEYYYFIKQH